MAETPRDFNKWMKSVERRLQQALRSGQSAQAVQLAREVQVIRDEIGAIEAGTGPAPAAPVELVVQTRLFVNSEGRHSGEISVDFPDVTRAVNGDPITVDRYELWVRDVSNWDESNEEDRRVWVLQATASESSLSYAPLIPKNIYQVRVRAVARGVPSPYSAIVERTIEADTTPPPIPAALELTSSGATVTASWNLLAETGERMPSDFAFTEVAYSYHPAPSEVVAKLTNLFSQYIFETPPVPDDADYDGTWYFRHRAVDTSGNRSEWSPQSSIVPKRLVDEASIRFEMDEKQREIDAMNVLLNSGLSGVNQNLIPLQQLSDQNKSRLDELNTVTLPGINNSLQAVKSDMTTAQGQINTLNNTTIPGINSTLDATNSSMTTARGQIDTLNNTTIPGINSTLSGVQSSVNTINNTTIPGVRADLAAAQATLNDLDSSALRDLTGVIQAKHMAANSVIANAIAANAVTTAKIATNAVTANEIAALTITAGNIAADAITTAKIATNAITANELAANSVQAGHITANAVTTAKIATGAVTANEVAALAITAEKLAANSVVADKIAANAVTTEKIATNAVTANEIAANTIVAGNIATNAIQARHLQANSVGADQVIANSIGTGHLQARSVQVHQLQVGSFDNLFSDQQFTSYRDHSTGTNSPWVRAWGNPHNVWQWENDSNVGASIVSVASGAASRMELYCGEVAPGDQMSFRIRVRKTAGADGFRIHARHRGENRSSPQFTTTILGASFSGLPEDSVWESNWTVPSNAGIRELWIDFETLSTSTGTARFSEPYMRRRVDSQLLVDGSVLTDKLAANAVTSDKITANAITAREIAALAISAGHVQANAITADKINFGSLNGSLITGLQIQTHTNNRGVKITNAGIRAFDSGGSETFNVDATTGSVTAAGGTFTGGTFQTSSNWASAGGAVVRQDGRLGNFAATNTSGQVTARLGGTRNELSNLAILGPLRMGSSSAEGGLVPDKDRLRLQGRLPFDAGAGLDMFQYGLSPVFGPAPTGGFTWDVVYPEARPFSNSGPIVTCTTAGSTPSVTAAVTDQETVSGFQARATGIWLAGGGIDNHRFRIRYVTFWRG